MLLLINTLIGNINFEQALLYSRVLLKIIEISLEVINLYYKGKNEENYISSFTKNSGNIQDIYIFIFLMLL